MVRVHHVNLAGLVRIGPIVGRENRHARLQEAKIIQKAKID